jgi:ammonia channel protein AmtB
VQFGAAAGVVIYTALATWVILKGAGAIVPLRVDEQEENTGLDLVLHDEAG